MIYFSSSLYMIKNIKDIFIEITIMYRLNLSYNGLTSASASLFASAIEGNNCITHLDLSWNKMSVLKGK